LGGRLPSPGTPGALSVAEMHEALVSMGVNIPITVLSPKQPIELSR
jgi:hypothetical protein